MDWVYLDNNATTQPAEEVVAAMRDVLETLWANPSSVHRMGQLVRQRVELARAEVAQLLQCRPRELLFTSGGTESNNLALWGVLGAACAGGRPGPAPLLITARTEHSAVRQPAEALAEAGVRLVHVPTDGQGQVAPGDVEAALREHLPQASLALVSIQWANNETGVVQPVAAIARAVAGVRGSAAAAPGVRPPPVLFHVDATQAVGKIPVDATAAGVDLLTLAAHKFHGPKGVGALFVRSGVRLRRQVHGGPQERELRGGTENVPGIVGLGAAAALARPFLADPGPRTALAGLRDRLEAGLARTLPDIVVNGGQAAQRLWNTSNVGFPRLEAEAILLGLSERGVCASAGAACSSGSLEPSPVLLAMGVPEPIAHGSVRFSLSRFSTAREIDQALRIVPEVVGRLRQVLPVGGPAGSG